MSLEQAIQKQFELVDIMQRVFSSSELLEAGDFGVTRELGRPRFTAKAESVLAEFFDAEDAALVREAGTGAIRAALRATLNPGDNILLHNAPIYPTTEVTIKSMGFKIIYADYNKLNDVRNAISREIKVVYIQRTRQKLDDSYDMDEVIKAVRSTEYSPLIVTDECYAVMRVEKAGVQLGADASAFSLFKLLGPPGIGCVVGSSQIISRIRKDHYSGGTQVQGPEAMGALRSLIYVPVTLAIQDRVVHEVADRLNRGEVRGVRKAHIANAEERTIHLEFNEPIAEEVTRYALKYGATAHPVGMESRYDVGVNFYRPSGTARKADPELIKYVIRINPLRGGPETIIRILKAAVEDAHKE